MTLEMRGDIQGDCSGHFLIKREERLHLHPGYEPQEVIYDGLQLTQDAKEKLKAADIQDEMNLAEFREHDLEEIGLKVASRVKVRAWIKHANRGNKKRTALGLLSSSSS